MRGNPFNWWKALWWIYFKQLFVSFSSEKAPVIKIWVRFVSKNLGLISGIWSKRIFIAERSILDIGLINHHTREKNCEHLDLQTLCGYFLKPKFPLKNVLGIWLSITFYFLLGFERLSVGSFQRGHYSSRRGVREDVRGVSLSLVC